MRRPQGGVALAWLTLIGTIPFVGALIYFLIGERRIGEKRARLISSRRTDYSLIVDAAIQRELTNVNWSKHDTSAHRLHLLGKGIANCPTVRGNTLNLYSDSQETLAAIAHDVNQAKTSVLMEFYVWNAGGGADDVLEAVIRAAKRGITCRLLIDALGSRPWWKGDQPRRLRDAGVQLMAALPVGIFRTFIGRADLRLHRKIIVVDGTIAWTGSMNMVDPHFFKQSYRVGLWIDAMVRVEGSSVALLAATMVGDWMLESCESLEQMIENTDLRLAEPKGQADVQVFPSGPGQSGDGLLQMILETINASDTELVLTTPYLVPDESLLRALRGAAGRGVKVQLIVPEKVDSILVRYASRSYFDDLLAVGIEIHLFRGGLLHTKSVIADRSISMFGTVNLDLRSLWLNYEVAMFIYDRDFAERLHELQLSYLNASDRLMPEDWRKRSYVNRLLENTLRLMSPLL